MGGILSSEQAPRDVVFHPDDIIITDNAFDQIKLAAQNTPENILETAPKYATESAYSGTGMNFSKEVEEIENRYERRLQLVEKRNEELFKEAAEEYTRTVERLENKYMKPTPGGCCTAAQQRVEDCYVNNPGKILLCSKLVAEYERCVQNYRLAMARNADNMSG